LKWLARFKRDIPIDRLTVSQLMTPDPITLNPDDTIYQALSLLSLRRIKHLPIVEGGRIKGIVTLRQLLKLRHPEPLAIINEIHNAENVNDLREIKYKLPQLAADKLSIGINSLDIVTMISLINQDLHKKAIEMALKELGEPPHDINIFVSGSHGRVESLLTADQDHGMIIEDTDTYYENQEYYMNLSWKLSEMLNHIGYVYCPGYIMCMNPTWRKTVKEWKIQILYWFESQISALTRYLTILYDSYPVFGNLNLFNEVRDFSFMVLKEHHEALRVLHEEEGSHKVPIGLFGNFITEKEGPHRGELDIKRSGLIFIVESVRILAIMHGIRETMTIKRIEALVEKGVIHKDDGEYFASAFVILLHYALKSQVEKFIHGQPIDTFVRPSTLSSHDRDLLKQAFKAVSALQELVSSELGELVL
ncbi:MAG: CBS domain-containing protein, partial [Nitrospirae bacterium]|nr:CBS domain-containing protein [Nitrospirota bacterium]